MGDGSFDCRIYPFRAASGQSRILSSRKTGEAETGRAAGGVMIFSEKTEFQIVCHRTLDEVRSFLESKTASWGIGHFPLGEGAFVGEIGVSDFKFVPRPLLIRLYPQSYVVLTGSIREQNGDTVLDVKIRPIWGCYVFDIIWPILGLFIASAYYRTVGRLSDFGFEIIVPVIFLLVYLGKRVKIHYEVEEAQWMLKTILKRMEGEG